MTTMKRLLAAGAALALLAALAVGNAGWLAGAQNGNGDAQVPSYPFAIHEGTCDEPAEEAAFDLGEAAPFGLDQDDAGRLGPLDAVPVLSIETTIESTYEELLQTSEYVLAVHQSADEFGTLVACGALGGIVDGGRLSFGLNQVDGSGVTGVAVLDDDTGGSLALGENEVLVRVYLLAGLAWEAGEDEAVPSPTPPAAEDAEATPAEEEEAPEATPEAAEEEEAEATPAEEEDGAEEEGAAEDEDEGNGEEEGVTVEAVDIDFNPNEFSIAADTDVVVTVVNNGEQLHTFTIDELDINVELDPGATEEITINAEAGEYVYYCTVPGHREAGQEGTMTVE